MARNTSLTLRNEYGVKIRDVTELVDLFEAQEGTVEHITGKTGQGKTYEATRRAIGYLLEGKVVYTSWELILPDIWDQRENFEHLLLRFVFNRKRFYRFDIKANWHYVDIDRPDLVEFIASRTDCIFMLDEGQDVFDARGGMDRRARQAITRTRHYRKTLIIVSQRAQAVDVTARANVTYYYQCVKDVAWFWPFALHFKVYRTEEMDDQNYPIWEERRPDGKMWKAPIWRSHFAEKRIYNAYNSWYLRKGLLKTQDVHFEAFDLTQGEKLKAMFNLITGKVKRREHLPSEHVMATLVDNVPVLTKENEVQYTHATPQTSHSQSDTESSETPRSQAPLKAHGKATPRSKKARTPSAKRSKAQQEPRKHGGSLDAGGKKRKIKNGPTKIQIKEERTDYPQNEAVPDVHMGAQAHRRGLLSRWPLKRRTQAPELKDEK